MLGGPGCLGHSRWKGVSGTKEHIVVKEADLSGCSEQRERQDDLWIERHRCCVLGGAYEMALW